MASRTVSHDLGDRTEVVVYSDGVEVSRFTKQKKQTPRTGDALKELLASYGITKEWLIDFKAKHGLPPSCECEARQEWLNKLSDNHPELASIGVKLLNALKRKNPNGQS